MVRVPAAAKGLSSGFGPQDAVPKHIREKERRQTLVGLKKLGAPPVSCLDAPKWMSAKKLSRIRKREEFTDGCLIGISVCL